VEPQEKKKNRSDKIPAESLPHLGGTTFVSQPREEDYLTKAVGTPTKSRTV
jgi:hypothetical protein